MTPLTENPGLRQKIRFALRSVTQLVQEIWAEICVQGVVDDLPGGIKNFYFFFISEKTAKNYFWLQISKSVMI